MQQRLRLHCLLRLRLRLRLCLHRRLLNCKPAQRLELRAARAHSIIERRGRLLAFLGQGSRELFGRMLLDLRHCSLELSCCRLARRSEP